jgi:hypothetical protein
MSDSLKQQGASADVLAVLEAFQVGRQIQRVNFSKQGMELGTR